MRWGRRVVLQLAKRVSTGRRRAGRRSRFDSAPGRRIADGPGSRRPPGPPCRNSTGTPDGFPLTSPVHDVGAIEWQVSGLVRIDLGVQLGAEHQVIRHVSGFLPIRALHDFVAAFTQEIHDAPPGPSCGPRRLPRARLPGPTAWSPPLAAIATFRSAYRRCSSSRPHRAIQSRELAFGDAVQAVGVPRASRHP